MRDFVLFFEEKEGTSAMMRWADRLDGVNVLHHTNGRGWEPLEPFLLGYDLKQHEIERLLTLVFAKPRDEETLRQAYAEKRSDRELVPLGERRSVGFKMRWKPPRVLHVGANLIDLPVNRLFKSRRRQRYLEAMVRILQEHDVQPMLAVRQNVFAWALSKYHGDGQGGKGHLQFKLASGELDREDIPKIRVDLKRFGRLVEQCRRKHDAKRAFVQTLNVHGLSVKPLLYEDFLEDKAGFFEGFLTCLGHTVDRSALERAFEGDIDLKRVHKGPLSEYVENHAALEREFGSAFEPWSSAVLTP